VSSGEALLHVLFHFAKQSLANRHYQVELGNEEIAMFPYSTYTFPSDFVDFPIKSIA